MPGGRVMTMLPNLIWWLTIVSALGAGLTIAAHRASCARHKRRMWDSADESGPIEGLILLFVPCKGAEPGLTENLRTLFKQRLVRYELRFIVEDANDGAVAVIEQLQAEYPEVPSRLIVAGRAEESGQKIHNLRVATEFLPPACTVLAFADSDVRPDPLWLHSLTHVLTRPGVGASTGYRWFVPERLTLPNLLAFSMNAGAASCLGRRLFNLIWGGSWAIQRTCFEQIGLREVWRGTLNDDLVATQAIRGAGLKIDFETRCLCPSPIDFTWRQAMNFIHRQLLQARYHAPGHFRWGAAALLLQAAAYLLVVGTLALDAIRGQLNELALAAGAALIAVNLLRAAVGHATWRQTFAAYESRLRPARQLEYLLSPLLSLLAAACVVRTCFDSTMDWRGLRYRLLPGGKIQFLGRRLDAALPAASAAGAPPRILPFRGRDAA